MAHPGPAVAAPCELGHVRGDLPRNVEYALARQRTNKDADDGLAG
jgi:hypothetical protein